MQRSYLASVLAQKYTSLTTTICSLLNSPLNVHYVSADSVFCSVVPQTGTALIFNHDTLHEGEPVSSGTKYIIRTEIMYRRVDTEMIPNPGAYQSQGNYIKTLTLYQKSWELEKGVCICVYLSPGD